MRPFMRCSALISALLSMAVLTGCGAGAKTEPAAVLSTPLDGPVVETKRLDFIPATIKVKVGQTVTWRNADGIPHTVTSGSYTVGGDGARTSESPDGTFDHRLSGVGTTVSHTYTEPGEFPYYCRPHEAMNAKVVVEP